MDGSRRRAVLATLGSVAVAGCLNTGDSEPTDDEGSSDADDSATQEDDSTPTEDTATTPGTDDESGASETETDTPEDQDTPDGNSQDGESETPDNSETPDDDIEPPSGDRDDELFPDYDMTNVRVQSSDGSTLGWVRAAIADTRDKQITGLSDTDSLPEQYGMLFVYSDVDDRRFVMREMDFGIDIIYADNEGVITTIHHAEKPGPDEDGSNQVYPGRGQYVLEVNYHWTTARDVTVGDSLGELPTR